MKTLITGGTGFVGTKLLPKLDQPDVVTRNAARAVAKLPSGFGQPIEWDPTKGPTDLSSQAKYQAVVNLMGESIAEGRWTAEKKRRIRDSRVLGTRNLVDSLIKSNNVPDVMVSTSAVGLYGSPGEEVVTEQHPAASGFLADVCREWEEEADRLSEHGARVVNLRIGIVLGPDGGALEKMIPLFKFGLGGKLGSGTQWMPWIHVDDLVGLILWSITNTQISGPVNAVAPNPVRNAEFTRSLVHALSRPAFLPAPAFALRLALGEFADSLLASQRVVPEVALKNGFSFQHPTLDQSMADLVGV